MSDATPQMPSFDFPAGMEIDMETMEKESQGSRFLKPGTYTAKIVDVKYLEKIPKGDSAWRNFSITLGTSNDQTTKKIVMVPTPAAASSGFRYGTKVQKNGEVGTFFPLHNLKTLLSVVGLKVGSSDDLTQSIAAAFNTPAKSRLLNKEVQITLAYTRPYLAYANNAYSLVNADGTEHLGFAGKTWAERDSANQEVEEVGGFIPQGFPEVTELVAVKKSGSASAAKF